MPSTTCRTRRRSELPRLRKSFLPETPVCSMTLGKAERIQWEAATTHKMVNSQVLAFDEARHFAQGDTLHNRPFAQDLAQPAT